MCKRLKCKWLTPFNFNLPKTKTRRIRIRKKKNQSQQLYWNVLQDKRKTQTDLVQIAKTMRAKMQMAHNVRDQLVNSISITQSLVNAKSAQIIKELTKRVSVVNLQDVMLVK